MKMNDFIKKILDEAVISTNSLIDIGNNTADRALANRIIEDEMSDEGNVIVASGGHRFNLSFGNEVGSAIELYQKARIENDSRRPMLKEAAITKMIRILPYVRDVILDVTEKLQQLQGENLNLTHQKRSEILQIALESQPDLLGQIDIEFAA